MEGREVRKIVREIKELKKQMANTKYLDRNDIEKLVNSLNGDEDIKTGDCWLETDCFDTVQKARDWLINEILNLAIPITKKKIIEVLESPLGKNYKAENNITLLEKLRGKIASEILGE